jgi:preprotein translocase subunit SecG
MTVLIVIVHVLVCLIMIGVILLQAGKGAEVGAAFGGSVRPFSGAAAPPRS